MNAATNAQNKTNNIQPSLSPWTDELKAMLHLGIPMGLTQLVQFSTHAVDLLMIGRLGAEALAGAAIGVVIYFTTWLLGFGPAAAVSPVVSQALGANKHDVETVRIAIRMGLWAVLLTMPLITLIFLSTTDIALFLGQPETPARLAGPYVVALAPGIPFALGVLVLRNFLAAINKTQIPLLLIVAGAVLNMVLNYMLIFGNFGAPRLELVGAGIASSLSHMAGFCALLAYCYWTKEARRFDVLRSFFEPRWPVLREIVRLGWPIGLTMAFEGTLFNAAVFLMGRLGTNEVAAYQVALNIAAMAFMMPLGLSMAGSVRVGLAAGVRDRAGALRAALVSIGVCVTAIALVAINFVLWPRTIAGFYLDANDPANTVVIEMVVQFLLVAAAFALFDAIQVSANQSLRGLKDVRIPMIIAGISCWIVGFPVSAYLGLMTPLGAIGIWIGLLAALITISVLLGWRLFWLLGPSRRLGRSNNQVGEHAPLGAPGAVFPEIDALPHAEREASGLDGHR